MSCEIDTAATLRRAGQRVTPQRMAILGALRHSEGHVSANTIYEEIHESYPYMDISTIYRTLNAACEAGLVVELDVGKRDAEFEWSAEAHHYHLICRLCGVESEIEGVHLDQFVQAIKREHGFIAELEHMAIRGVCRNCSNLPA